MCFTVCADCIKAGMKNRMLLANVRNWKMHSISIPYVLVFIPSFSRGNNTFHARKIVKTGTMFRKAKSRVRSRELGLVVNKSKY